MVTDSIDTNLSKLWEIVKDREAWCGTVHGVARVRYDLVTEQQQRTESFLVIGIPLCSFSTCYPFQD